MDTLRIRFRPEFLNRLDEIIIFEALNKEQIRQIVELQLERVKRIAHGQGITLKFEKSVVDHLAKQGYLPEYGARELRRQIKSEIENKLAREMLSGKVSEGTKATVSYDQKAGILIQPSNAKARKARTKATP